MPRIRNWEVARATVYVSTQLQFSKSFNINYLCVNSDQFQAKPVPDVSAVSAVVMATTEDKQFTDVLSKIDNLKSELVKKYGESSEGTKELKRELVDSVREVNLMKMKNEKLASDLAKAQARITKIKEYQHCLSSEIDGLISDLA